MEKGQGRTDKTVQEYQKVLHQFKMARAALTVMSQSLEVEMCKFREEMQPVVLSRGIAKVPDEILARILLLSTTPKYNWDVGGSYYLRIGQVCKRFNSIIINQPEVWSYVSSKMGSEELATRLHRSRAVGLKVYLVDDLGVSDRRAGFISALKELLKHAARWEFLVLGLSDSKRLGSFDELGSKREFPRLRHFSIAKTIQNYKDARLDICTMCKSWTTPQLCTLFSEVILPTVPIAAKVTDLRLQVSTDTWMLKYLPRMLNMLSPTLTYLWLGFDSVQLVGDEDLKVQLPCLQGMHLDFSFCIFDDDDKEERCQFDEDIERTYKFALFNTPELEHLTVTLSSAIIWPWLMNDFLYRLSELQRDSAKLRYLNVVHDEFSLRRTYDAETDILEVLCGLSAVEFINISNMLVEISPSTVSKTVSLEGKRFRLRQLHLDRCIGTKKQIEGLLQVLTSSTTFPEFERLVLSNCTGFKWEELVGLKGLEYLVVRNE